MAVKASDQITMTDVTDIDATYRYYLLQGSTLTKPAKPTTYPPSSSWTKTEPSYTAGSTNSLYFTDCTVYSNGEFAYSEVSLSSSYEAAKVAYNKAVAAQTSADNAAKVATNYIDYDSTNGLQVGNKSSGSWTGFRTQITSSAFNILNAAGETLASYGAKLIELGKNATDAVIKLCGGKARIEYDGDSYWLNILADRIRLKGITNASLYSENAYIEFEVDGETLDPVTTFSRVYESVVETHTESSDDITSCYTIIGAKQTTTDNVNDTEETQEAQIRVECDKIKFTADYLLLNNKLCGLSIDLLWINPSPLATFKAQAVTVPDMSQYAFIAIEYTLDSEGGSVQTAIGRYGVGIRCAVTGTGYVGRRTASFTDDTTLTFGSAYYNSAENNKYAIPTRIYGIRCPINDMTEY